MAQKIETSEPPTRPAFCPQCGFPVDAEDIFCGECGFELTQPAPESSAESLSFSLTAPAFDELAARVARYKPARGLRRSYFDLGLALKAAARYPEAAEAFEHALGAPGSAPPAVDVLFQQAYAREQSSSPERAFRPYLEAVLRSPNDAAVVLPHVHPLVSAAVVLENSAWLTTEWAACLEQPQVSPPNRVHLAAFLGRTQLFLSQTEPALAAFESAMQADPQLAPIVIEPLLSPAALPPEYSPQAGSGPAQFTLARIWRVLQRGTEALRTVEIALNLNLGQGSYPEAPVQRLKADLLLDAGRKSEAAQWYYEAGRRYLWRGEYELGGQLLEKSVGLKPDPAACWNWMEAERSRAYLPQPPYALAAAVQRSLKAWKIGLKSGWPDQAYFWVYTTRALLAELEARLDQPHRSDHWWNAIQWLEAALLWAESDVYSWAYLGRFFRYLNLAACAEQATRRALELEADHPAALEERAAILANLGRFDEAAAIIARREKLGPNGWVSAVKAYVIVARLRAAEAAALYRGEQPLSSPEGIANYQQALGLIDQVMASDYPDIWYREIRLVCLRSLPGQLTEARAEAERLYAACLDPHLADSPDMRLTRGWAAVFTGRWSAAEQAFAPLRQDPILSGSGWRSLGVYRLATGDFTQGEVDLLKGLERTRVARECDDLANDLHDFAPHIPLELGERLYRKIAERRAQLIDLPVPLAELEGVLRDPTPLSQAGQTGHAAGLAVVGRLALADGRFSEALDAYQRMADESYPGRSQGLVKAWASWQKKVDQALKERQLAAARQELEQLIAQIPAEKNPEPLAEMLARLALVHFSLDQAAEGRAVVARAIQAANEAQWVAAGEGIGEIWRELLADPAHLWQVDAYLAALADDERLAADAAGTRASLPTFLDGYFHLDAELNAKDDPYPLPIQVWVSSQLEPLVDPKRNERFILKDVPAVRQRIREDRGIAVPAMKVSIDQASQNYYHIDLLGWMFAYGEVFSTMSYTSAALDELLALGIPRDALVPGDDPLSGKPGCWVAQDWTRQVSAAEHDLYGPIEFILRHLEAVLRRDLALFVDVALVQRLLGRLDARWNDLIDHVLPDPAAHLAFARLVRALVREGVPVTRLEEVLQVIPTGGLTPANFAVVLRAARLRLKDQLPFRAGQALVALPPEWERRLASWLVTQGERTDFAPPLAESAEMLAALGQWIAPAGRHGALLVQDPMLRPYLRRLTEAQFPDWQVLAQEELPPTRSPE